MAEGRHWSPWRKEARGDVLSGCGGGCLGCLGLIFLFAVLLGPANRYEKWSGFPEVLDGLHPGMTVEEARAVFPGHCTFEEKEEDCFSYHTWVVSPEAVPVRMLHVLPGTPKNPVLSWGQFLTRFSGGANAFFDADGRLVGVQELAWDGHYVWQAKWGTLRK